MSIRYAFVIVLAAAIIFILVGQPVIAISMDHYDLAS